MAILTRALHRAEQAGLRHATAESLAFLALACRDTGDRRGAGEAARRAEQIARECGFRIVLERSREVLDDDVTLAPQPPTLNPT